MKTILTTYTFTPASKTVDLSATSGFDIKRLLAIINAKTSQLIYAAGSTGLGYTNVAAGVVTLAFDTTAMGSTDPLTVIYEAASNTDYSTAAKQDLVTAAVNSVLAKISADPSTGAKQSTQITAEQAIQASTASLDTKTPALNVDGGSPVHVTNANTDPATGTNQATGNTALAAIAAAIKSEDVPTIQSDKGIPILAVRQDGPGSLVDATGDYSMLQVNPDGRLKVSILPAAPDNVLGTITTTAATAAAATATSVSAIDVTKYSAIILQIDGTFTSVNAVFEFSMNSTDGVNGRWNTCPGLIISTGISTANIATQTLATLQTIAYKFSTNGYSWIRLRVSAFTGTANLTTTWSPAALPTEPSVTLTGAPAISGTVTAAIAANSIIASVPLAAAGYTVPTRIVSAATTNAQVVKAAATNLGTIIYNNLATSARLMDIYNKATAPTIGSDIPVITLLLPAGVQDTLNIPAGVKMTLGVGITITDTSRAALTVANEVNTSFLLV